MTPRISLATGAGPSGPRKKQVEQVSDLNPLLLPFNSKAKAKDRNPLAQNPDPPHLLTGGSQSPNTTSGLYQIVGSGIDTLIMGYAIGRYLATQQDFDRLDAAKAAAGVKQFGNKNNPIEWFDKQFSISPKGSKGYEWVISNRDVTVCIAKIPQGGRIFPEVYVTFRSEFLWGCDYVRAHNIFKSWLSSWAAIVGEKVSRCDLCVDLAMYLPNIDTKQEIITRAKRKCTFSEIKEYSLGHHYTGYWIGANDLLCRIYDKTTEIKKSQKEWFKEVWRGQDWNGLSAITRVEFQLRRETLKEFSANSFSELSESLADIWRYCTEDWLTIRDVNTADSKRYRWPIKDYWQVVQSAIGHFGSCRGILRYKQSQCKADHLVAQLKGVSISWVATLSLVYGEYGAKRRVKEQFLAWLEDGAFWLAVQSRKARISQISD